MTGMAHELWHIFVLVAGLCGAAAVALLVLEPLILGSRPPGWARYKPLTWALSALAALIVLLEWQIVH